MDLQTWYLRETSRLRGEIWGIITTYVLIKAMRLNGITMGERIEKEKFQGLSTIAFRGQGGEEEAAKKTRNG